MLSHAIKKLHAKKPHTNPPSLQVSRRFDRRKFSIRFSAQKHAGDDYDFSRLAEARTTPIAVFSKRKVKDIDPQDASSKKRRRLHTAKASDLDEMKAKYAKLFQEIRMTLEHQVCN